MGARLLERFPDLGEAWCQRGIGLTDVSRYEEAQKSFERALEFCDPVFLPTIWREKGILHQRQGDFPRALECFARAAEIAPQRGSLGALVGETLLMSGELEQAENSLRSSLSCAATNREEIYNVLGRVFNARECYPQAKTCFHRALDLCPDSSDAFVRLGELKALEKVGTSVMSSVEKEDLIENLKKMPLLFLAHFRHLPVSSRNHFRLWIDRARALGRLCRYAEARDAFEQARGRSQRKDSISRGVIRAQWKNDAATTGGRSIALNRDWN